MKKEKWIVACSGSDWDTIYISRIKGTEEDIKAHMLSIIEKDVDDNLEYDDVEFRTKTAEDIEWREDENKRKYLYGFVSWSTSHADYVARKEKTL